MIIIDDIIVSDEIRDARFCCDLKKCKGACCVEGDAGAPIEEEEISILEDYIDDIKPFMNEEGIEVIDQGGVFDYDASGEYVTPLVNDKDCAFVIYENGITKCAIEKAWEAGKIDFQKPISCHLYPIRISKNKEFEAVNYHQWYICEPARTFGKRISLPVYKFLKDPLIRKYGKSWYQKMENLFEGK